MDGVAAIRQLLAADAQVTALVPASGVIPPRLVAGTLPQGVALPALSIVEISLTDFNIPAPGATRHVQARIQVTGAAKDYPSLRALMRKVKHACADTFPVVTGITNVTVHAAGVGPDMFDEEAAIVFKSQDFMVGYNEPT